jgi:hypothetical protein
MKATRTTGGRYLFPLRRNWVRRAWARKKQVESIHLGQFEYHGQEKKDKQ